MKNNNDLIFGSLLLFNVFVIEFVGFFASGSVAVLAYSFFIFSELSVFAILANSSKKKLNKKLSGFLSVVILLAAAIITNMSVQRYFLGSESNGIVIIVFSIVGIFLTTSVMSKVKNRYEKAKKRSLTRVIMSNLPSTLVLATGIWITFTGETMIDNIFGMVISFMMILQAIRILRGSAFKSIKR